MKKNRLEILNVLKEEFSPKKGRHLYIDCEWFISQKMYLIGYAYNLKTIRQLYEKTLTRKNVLKMLEGVTVIYFWGPDIGMIEKCFNLKLRERYFCVNLLAVMRAIEPHSDSFKLAHFEKLAGIERTTMEYKADIRNLHRDWANPKKRYLALKYNQEDVLNMIKVKRYFFKKNGITDDYLWGFRMQ